MTATFHVGDAIEVMNKLPEKSVDLILTSPPFLALRSYLPADHPDKGKEIGSEPTPAEYVDRLIDVVEACDRVLAPHGSLCIELGDTYAGSGGAGGDYDPGGWREGQEAFEGSGKRIIDAKYEKVIDPEYERSAGGSGFSIRNLHGKKQGGGSGWPLAKSLSLIPELFRLTLVYGTNPLTGRTTERWRLRNVVRWVRPNPPVGALGDKWRPATSELMVFCKSAKRYFDLDATREPASSNTHARSSVDRFDLPSQKRDGNWSTLAQNDYANPAGAPPLDWWNIPLLEGEEETQYGPEAKEQRKALAEMQRPRRGDKAKVTGFYGANTADNPLGAPPLDWWNIPPGGYEGAHYAVFPPELCIKPIKAMCPEKVCRVCGEPSRRISENTYTLRGEAFESPKSWDGERLTQNAIGVRKGDIKTHVETLGFSDCGHDDWRPGLVLDPFGGSGTTALVATGHGRDCILIDLDERNYDLALERVGPFILSRAESV